MSISVCMIAKNEERFIGGCIDHLKNLAKEIIVVDTGSSDRTVEIAQQSGARVSSTKWENDFAKARNLSLDKATQKWILIIDPDERIADRDIERILALTNDTSNMAYSFNARNYSENPMASGFIPCQGAYSEEEGYPGYFESRKVRLFQNIPSIRFKGSVHELVESTVKGKIVESDIPFHHFGSSKQVAEEKAKRQFYQKRAEQKVSEEPGNWKAHFEQGVEWLGASEYKKAAVALKKAREFNPQEKLVLSNLGYALMESGQHDEAEEALKACLKVDPRNHDAVLNLGVNEMRRQRYDRALQIFDKLVRMYPNSFLAFRNSGNCLARLKKMREAAACFEKALSIFPDYNDARIDLGIVCFAAGRLDLAEKVLNVALQRDPMSLRTQAVLDEIKKLKSTKKA
ncbi:MAG: hypothetical protein COV44_06210 [Deltaproteobacteria bacterium CG11_big_fil_rev_8_21_14_0_20_45_16]|nr:MAG: hypothetical protein COV44_06210 [Deltaproteobacteria bacterium CG11_big_fil_rev_8_21_14_0_20_45_16]